jgi:Fibronectin type III domain
VRLATALVLLLLAAPAAAGKPRTPTKLRVTAIDQTSVRVTWHNRSRAARPQLAWRRVGSPKRRAKKVRRRRGATKFLHRGLQPGARYVYRVRACRRGRCSRWSRRRRGGPLAPGMGAPAPGPPPGGGPTVGSCPIFPPGNPWNRDVSADPVDPRSAAYVASIGAGLNLHPDFGSNPAYGLPYIIVPASQPRLPVVFSEADESDPGPYPIPANAPVEAGSDRHVLALQDGTCRLYELFSASFGGGSWSAYSGAVFDLRTGAPRPDGWTSADAAGLPILPGLVRYDEVRAGAIRHALRFTVSATQRAYVHPATHFASDATDPNLPPMGLRLRLKSSFAIGGYSREAQVILSALKRYGMFVADNGSSWFISGASDPRWNDEALDDLKQIPGSAFEVVASGPLHKP